MISRIGKTKSRDGEERLTATVNVSEKNDETDKDQERQKRYQERPSGVSLNRAKMNKDFTGLIEPYDTMSVGSGAKRENTLNISKENTIFYKLQDANTRGK
jgi:hypothetical protein